MKGYYTIYALCFHVSNTMPEWKVTVGSGEITQLTDVSRRRKTKSEITLISQQITKSKTVG